ncbi:MAG: hypothetical protein E7605_04245 [Ruminococcaceae bacterium]|nr:hypothetical protein [Oscillospiraceae bacterium]
MEWLRERCISAKRARNSFAAETVVWFTLALMIGTLAALAEYRLWLPCRVLRWFELPGAEQTIFDCIGLLLSQTIFVPLLFLAGLHRTTYYYTSRVVAFLFWFWHGVDVWKYILAVRLSLQSGWLFLFLIACWLFCLYRLMIRIHFIATAGVTMGSSRCGMRPRSYLTAIFQGWGGILILQILFYGLYIMVS